MDACSLYSLNFPNGKRYIGISKTPGRRFAEHKRLARLGGDFPVHRALRKYADAVTMNVMVVGDRDYIAEMEIAAIEKFSTRTREHGYNVSFGGEISPMLVPEVAARVALAKTGAFVSEESRERMRQAQLGRKHSDETRAKMSAAQMGRIVSPETRAKSSAAKLGKKMSDETRAKMSLARTGRKFPGRKWTEKTRAIMKIARVGRSHSDETKAKMRAAQLGRKHTPETQAKMRASQARRRARDSGKAG